MQEVRNVEFELTRSQSRARGLQWIVRKHWEEVSDKGGKTATEFKRQVVARCAIDRDPDELLARAMGKKTKKKKT